MKNAGGQLGADQRQRTRNRVEAALRLAGTTTREGAQQADGVRMLRLVEHLGGQSLLDDLAGIHDTDAVADASHNAEVMRNQEHCRTRLLA